MESDADDLVTGPGEHPRRDESLNRARPSADRAPRLRVLCLEPYFGLSHETFLEGYRRFSRHEVEIWSLPPRKWKWRMRGAVYEFCRRAREESSPPDVILASDYVHLAEWKALAPAGYRETPSVIYFHENQLTYPLSEGAPPDFHYGWINLSSALAAERVLFNSGYHRREFLGGVAAALGRMPDFVPEHLPAEIERKSGVFPVGNDFSVHRKILAAAEERSSETPIIVWNHRWEYDKDPDRAVEALIALKRRGIPFRADLCGEVFEQRPAAFERARRELEGCLVQIGYYEDHTAYLEALVRADFVLSTARHEFFGVAVVEAMYMGCIPILPHDLSYPEIVPAACHADLLYERKAPLDRVLERVLASPPIQHREALRAAAARSDWTHLAGELDAIVDETAGRANRRGA